VCGRRAGKSFVLAVVAVFLACFRDWRPHLAVGEKATIMVIATDRKQARVIFRYIRGLLSIPMLAPLIERETSEIIDLSNSVTIEIAVASHRTTRGYTFAAILCDELAFWDTSEDAAEPDYAILDALRPGLGTLPGSVLLCASSPYAQSGALYDAYRRFHGQDDAPVMIDDVCLLIAQIAHLRRTSSTREMEIQRPRSGERPGPLRQFEIFSRLRRTQAPSAYQQLALAAQVP
jgi:hypothetical protein